MNKKIQNKKNLIIVIGAIIAILIIIKIIDNNYQNNENSSMQIDTPILAEKIEEEPKEKIVIYITGQVQHQGVIELDYGSRIADAIEKAGGTTSEANLRNVNLAYELEDGQKIYIPSKDEEETMIIEEGANSNYETKETVVNINKASSEQLQELNGIGKSLADTIIKYREENGKFKDIEELLNVPGIGDSKFLNIKEYVKI